MFDVIWFVVLIVCCSCEENSPENGLGKPVIESGSVMFGGRPFIFNCTLTNFEDFTSFPRDSIQAVHYVVNDVRVEIYDLNILRCLVEKLTINNRLETLTHDLVLSVVGRVYPPKIHVDKAKIVLYKGDTFRAVCESFEYEPELQWRKEALDETWQKIFSPPLPGTRRLKMPGSTIGVDNDAIELNLENVNILDSGKYFCGYKTMAYTEATLFDLEINGFIKTLEITVKDPKERIYDYYPKVVSGNMMLAGEKFLLACEAWIPPNKPYRLYWEVKPRFKPEFVEMESLGRRDVYFFENTLVKIENWTTTEIEYDYWHKSVVRCAVEERYQVLYDDIEMSVTTRSHPPPEIYYNYTEVTLNKGDNFSIFCESSVYEPRLKWVKLIPPMFVGGNAVFEPVQRSWNFQLPYGGDYYDAVELYLENVDYRSAGNYSCAYVTVEHVRVPSWELHTLGFLRNIYIFVRDEESLHLPQKSEFLLVDYYANLFNVPCIPTFPEVFVSLYYQEYKEKNRVGIYPKFKNPYVTFNPKNGFTVRTIFSKENIYKYVCVFHYQENLITEPKETEMHYSVLSAPSLYRLEKPTLGNFIPPPTYGTKRTLFCRVAIMEPVTIQSFTWKGPGNFSVTIEEFDVRQQIDQYRIIESSLLIDVVRESEGDYACKVVGSLRGFSLTTESTGTLYYYEHQPVPSYFGYMRGDTPVLDQSFVEADFHSSLTLVCMTNEPVVWRREFMEYPPHDVTDAIDNFDPTKVRSDLFPRRKYKGQTELQVYDKPNVSSVEFYEGASHPFVSKIYLTNLTAKDVGFYFCVYDSADLTDIEDLIEKGQAQSFYVFVKDTKTLHAPSVTNLTVLEGSKVYIPCKPSFMGVRMDLINADPNDDFKVDSFGSDAIQGFLMPDFYPHKRVNKYHCSLGYRGTVNKINYTVNVIPSLMNIDKPEFIKPRYLTYINDLRAEFKCVVKHNKYIPTLIEMMYPWGDSNTMGQIKREDSTFDLGNDTIKLEAKITIDEPNYEHEGLYECLVRDLHDNHAISSFYFQIHDVEKFEPLVSPESREVTIEVGKKMTLGCSSKKKAHWFRVSPEYRPRGDKSNYVENYLYEKGTRSNDLMYPVKERTRKTYKHIVTEGLPYKVQIELENIQAKDAGFYYCVMHETYNPNNLKLEELLRQKRASGVYLYVNGTDRLAADSGSEYYNGTIRFMKNTKYVIPCRPLNKNVSVSLRVFTNRWKDVEPEIQHLIFNPTEGFEISDLLTVSIRDYNSFNCKFWHPSRPRRVLDALYDAIAVSDTQYHIGLDYGLMVSGEPFTIRCYVENADENAIFYLWWSKFPVPRTDESIEVKDEQDITESSISKSTTLTIKNPEPRHAGLYECQMNNLYRIITKGVYIEHYEEKRIPPVIQPQQPAVTVEDGGTLALNCFGTKEVFWFGPSVDDRYPGDLHNYYRDIKNDKLYTDYTRGYNQLPKDRTTINSQYYPEVEQRRYHSHMIIEHMTVKDVGYYTCSHRSDQNLTVEEMQYVMFAARIYVYVNNTNELSVPMSYKKLILRNHTDFYLPCRPTNEDVSVTLYSTDGTNKLVEIPTNQIYAEFDKYDGYLVYFSNMVEKYGLGFSCKFSYNGKVVYNNYTAEKIIPVKYVEFPVEITRVKITEEPYTLTIGCRARSMHDVPFTLVWKLPSKTLFNRGYTNIKFTTNGTITEANSVLTMTNFDSSCSGIYRCERRDINDRRDNATIVVIDMTDLDIDPELKVLGQYPPRHMFCGVMIVTEEYITEKAFPWHARIGYRYCRYCNHIEYVCPGVLISEQHVLTTAHCLLRPYSDSLPVVTVGEHAPYKNQMVTAQTQDAIDFVYTHDTFQEEDSRIGLVVIMLKRPVRFSDYVYPICIHGAGDSWNSLLNKTYSYLVTYYTPTIFGADVDYTYVDLIDYEEGSSIPEFITTSGDNYTCLAEDGSPLMMYIPGQKYVYLAGFLVSDDSGRDDCWKKNRFLSSVYHLPSIATAVMKLHEKHIT